VSDVAILPRNGCLRKGGFAARGLLMRGRLRRPWRPIQVIGVLASALSVATMSNFPTERAGIRPIANNHNAGALGERLNANTIIIVSSNPNDTYSIKWDYAAAIIGGIGPFICDIGA
jgi:hypothetical protein